VDNNSGQVRDVGVFRAGKFWREAFGAEILLANNVGMYHQKCDKSSPWQVAYTISCRTVTVAK